MEKPKTYKQYVDSITGQMVTEEYARANPATTFRRTVTVKPRGDHDEVVLDDAPIEGPNQDEMA